MSIEENKALVHRAYDALNRSGLKAWYEFVTSDHKVHHTDADMSLEQDNQFNTMFYEAFPDAQGIIKDMVAEGDRVAVRVNWRGTHTGKWMDTAPTGNKLDITNTAIFRISGGKLAEIWVTDDALRFMQQLGMIPKQ
jgi:predicted ester cyclase